jgi:RNA polymerase sigma-70 factor (ECF subfamily)
MPSITLSDIAASEIMSVTRAQELEEIFREHYELVYQTARIITGNREDAEDVLQTIFLRLLRRKVPPDLQRNSKGYFYKAAVHASLNAIRSRKKQILTANADLFESPERTDAVVVDEAIYAQLREAIATLSPRAAEMVILRYVYDYSEPQIAKMLGRSRSTVAVTLFRARLRLRKLVGASSLGERV